MLNNAKVTIADYNKKVQGKNRVLKELYEWLEAVIYAFITILILFTFLFRVVGVEGTSMVPTLHSGDWLIISHAAYTPKRGDVVVITQPNKKNEPLIKRVIGLPGDTITIDEQNQVIVNGEKLNEPYTDGKPTYREDFDYPITVPDGYLFVMGDNRTGSWDSRYKDVGYIDERHILGKAVFRIYPFGQWSIAH